jgi:hypothetical protein
MKERLITFIDTDENTLLVRLKHERVQLAVVDSRPELEGSELRGFATALFKTYVAAPLIDRLDDARAKLDELRGKLAALDGGAALLAALDDSVRSVDEVQRAMSAPIVEAKPDPKPPLIPDYTPIGRRKNKKANRRHRAGEGPLLGWGWRRMTDDDEPLNAAS